MADSRQFGGPKGPQFGGQFGDKAPASQPGDGADCAQCEAMLADALDGTLSAADQAIFDLHISHCGPCGQMLADARRGAAWLEMLRDPRPEPPAQLLERILAQTLGAQTSGMQIVPSHPAAHEGSGLDVAVVPDYAGSAAAAYSAPAYGKVLPFRSRFTAAIRSRALGQILLQPRLAMTAAMAFFSIALTMNLTGVRLRDLHASDLRPDNLQRGFYDAKAGVVRYYEGLRVVYELESRVHDLQSATSDDVPAGTQTAPQPASAPSANPDQQPGPAKQKAAPQPDGKKPAPGSGSGTSHREDLTQSRRLVAANRGGESFSNATNARVERALA